MSNAKRLFQAYAKALRWFFAVWLIIDQKESNLCLSKFDFFGSAVLSLPQFQTTTGALLGRRSASRLSTALSPIVYDLSCLLVTRLCNFVENPTDVCRLKFILTGSAHQGEKGQDKILIFTKLRL